MSQATISDEIRFLMGLAKDKELSWAQVSGPCLRYLLACCRIESVLKETARLGVDSPLWTATELREAEEMKDNAEREQPHAE